MQILPEQLPSIFTYVIVWVFGVGVNWDPGLFWLIFFVLSPEGRIFENKAARLGQLFGAGDGLDAVAGLPERAGGQPTGLRDRSEDGRIYPGAKRSRKTGCGRDKLFDGLFGAGLAHQEAVQVIGHDAEDIRLYTRRVTAQILPGLLDDGPQGGKGAPGCPRPCQITPGRL